MASNLLLSDALANDLLDGTALKTQLDGGFISIYASSTGLPPAWNVMSRAWIIVLASASMSML